MGNIPADMRFLSGGGEMGRLMREKDWSNTILGPAHLWPQSLRTTLSIILNTKFPMFLFWGPEQICFYNDAYRPSLGKEGRHPLMLGMKGAEAWTDIWPVIKPLIDQVMSGGEATWSEDQLIPIYRNGTIEDVYWTFSYSPVMDESGSIAGVFVTCTETTDKVFMYSRLEESKMQLEFAIDATNLGTWDYNPMTNKFSANDRVKNWFGLSASELIDLSQAINVIKESDRERVVNAIGKALDYTSGGHYDEEYAIIQPSSQQEIIVHARGRTWFNEQQQAYRFNGTLEDVTAEVKARTQLEMSEERFRNFIAQSPLAMVVLKGPDHVIDVANGAMLKRWGKSLEEIENRKFEDVFPQIKNQRVPQLLDDVLKTGKIYKETEALSLIQDDQQQRTKYVDFEYSPLYDAGGIIVGVIATVSDVTERVESRKKLEASEQRFAAAVQAVKGIVWTNNANGEMTGEQPSWAELTGQTYEEYQGYGWSKAVHPDDAQPTIDAWNEAVRNSSIFNFEHRVKIKGGDWSAFSIKAIPLKNEDGSIREWVGVHTDIQKQKSFSEELERQVQERTRQLEEKNIELERMNKELQSFAYISSHDLQEPLRKIQTFASLIANTESQHLSSAGKDYFKRMQDAALRMQTLIDDLLAYSRTNIAERKYEETDLNSIVKEVEADLKEELEQKNVVVETHNLNTIKAIPFQIRQLLHNLMSNSIKFSREDVQPRITITSKMTTGKAITSISLPPQLTYCHITVADNGIGFEQKYGEKIFELFQRLHGRQQYNGTGIGLAIVKKIVENHQGIITATGEINKGAQFDIYLPVV